MTEFLTSAPFISFIKIAAVAQAESAAALGPAATTITSTITTSATTVASTIASTIASTAASASVTVLVTTFALFPRCGHATLEGFDERLALFEAGS